MPANEPKRHNKKKRKGARESARQIQAAPVSFLERHERRFILAACILAGLRVLIFMAAFPFFNNVDESAHFDMICKYSSGHIPTTLEPYCQEALRRDPWVRSMEYLGAPGLTPDNVPPPMWRLPKQGVEQVYAMYMPSMLAKINHESTQFPLYYAAMGLWFKLGKLLTLDGGHLVYWLRLINVPIYMLLVWLAYLFAKRFYARDLFARFGAPLLLVVFPQDVFYSLNGDVFSALFCALSLYGLLDICLSGSKSFRYHLLTGLAVAAAMLTKLSNLPMLVVLAIVLAVRVWRLSKSGSLRAEAPKLAALCLAALVPFALWLARNYFALGDLTGDGVKIKRLFWTYKPLSAIWDHPIYTSAGFGYFWSGLVKTFWRGEFVWFESDVMSPGMDGFYVWSSSVFLIASLIALWALRKRYAAEERFASLIGFVAIALGVAMLGFLSTLFDFGLCMYPSAALPFFRSGRLIIGVMIPFVIFYVRGLDIILSKIGLSRARFAVLSLIAIAILFSEIAISKNTFHSMYNWYHMF